MHELIHGKRILVTGGTGSVGSEIVRQLLTYDPATVRVLSRDDTKQFLLQRELGSHDNLRLIIGDIRDTDRLHRAMESVEIVFHVAALKHVPACEYNPFEAVETNVRGTQNVINAALERDVERMVVISSDKAAYPINVLGATKLLAERLTTSANWSRGSHRTIFGAVRFGNVIGSRGSVVPLFADQIARGGPVTVTDPEMTRFMMSLPQAVSLVFRSVTQMEGGEVFILKMASLRLGDLAEVMIESLAAHYGHAPQKIHLEILGARPGERSDEILMTEDEARLAVELPEMYAILPELSGSEIPHRSVAYTLARTARRPVVKTYTSRDGRLLDRGEIRAMLEEAQVWRR